MAGPGMQMHCCFQPVIKKYFSSRTDLVILMSLAADQDYIIILGKPYSFLDSLMPVLDNRIPLPLYLLEN